MIGLFLRHICNSSAASAVAISLFLFAPFAVRDVVAQRPTKSQDQDITQRNTIPKDVEPLIVASTDTDRARAKAIIEVYEILSSDPSAEKLSRYLADGYIQHSTMVPDGFIGLSMVFSSSVDQYPVEIDVHRIIVAGDWAMAHVNFRNLDTNAPDDLGTAAVDIYLFDPDGKIIEHWDVLQTVPTHSVNANGMFLQVFEGRQR